MQLQMDITPSMSMLFQECQSTSKHVNDGLYTNEQDQVNKQKVGVHITNSLPNMVTVTSSYHGSTSSISRRDHKHYIHGFFY